MTAAIIVLVGVFTVVVVSYGLGRRLGGLWFAIFIGLMVAVAALLMVSLLNATHAQAGMGEALIFIFIWIPTLVCGAIGGITGWVVRAKIKRPRNPAPAP